MNFHAGTVAEDDKSRTIPPGQSIRFEWVTSPPLMSSFHGIGAILDRVYYEGHPENERHGMQTVPLDASNGVVVEFIAPEEGEYTLVNHQFADAAHGATAKLVVK